MNGVLFAVRRVASRTSLGLAAFLTVIAIARLADAATYYVSTSGNDSNPGTLSLPFRTVAKGLTVVRAADTLFLRGGTYSENIDSNRQTIPSGTSWSDAPRIVAYPGGAPYEAVVLKGSGSQVMNLAHSYIQYVVFEGFVVDGADVSGGGISFYANPHHVRFLNMEVKNARGLSGISTSFPSGCGSPCVQNLEFINMKVHHNGGHGFYVASSGNLIDGCEIYSNGGLQTGNNHFGVQVYNGDGGRANNNVIRNSRIYGQTLEANAGGVVLGSGDGNMAYNNIVYNNNNGIQVISNGPTNTKILNNTIYNNSGFGIEVQVGSGAVVRNNILRLNGNDTSYLVSVTASNNFTADPNFTNPAGLDFNLQPQSPAIDAGATVPEVTNDFNGTPRPMGGFYDIGAYEFGIAVVPPAAPTNVRVVR